METGNGAEWGNRPAAFEMMKTLFMHWRKCKDKDGWYAKHPLAHLDSYFVYYVLRQTNGVAGYSSERQITELLAMEYDAARAVSARILAGLQQIAVDRYIDDKQRIAARQLLDDLAIASVELVEAAAVKHSTGD